MAATFADEQLAAWIRESTTLGDLDVVAMREGTAKRAATRAPGPEMDSVSDFSIGPLAVRLYRPGPGPLGLALYLHGGGWTIGSLETHDRVCRRLAAGGGVAVLALDYRLAPEHPWPASVDDAVAALRWIAAGSAELGETSGAVAVAGDSAGGTLAALACLRLRDEAPEAMPSWQVLLYANTDLTGSQPSMREKGTGFGLDAATVEFFNSQRRTDRSPDRKARVRARAAAPPGSRP